MKKRAPKVFAVGLILFSLNFNNCTIFAPAVKAAIGFASQDACARIFENGDTEANAVKYALAEITAIVPMPDIFWEHEVDWENESVTITAFGETKKAVHRQQLGCTVLAGISESELKNQDFDPMEPPSLGDDVWPYGSNGVDTEPVSDRALDTIEDVVDGVVHAENANTQAVLVAYNGKLIAKQYADGYSDANTFHGWSMTKTVTALLLGILQQQSKDTEHTFTTNTSASKFLPEWNKRKRWRFWWRDPRRKITIGNIMNMESGLQWLESYVGYGEVTEMYYESYSFADRVLKQKMRPIIRPKYRNTYSSGDTELLSEIITRMAVNETGESALQAGYDFYQDNLFQPLGLMSAVYSHDPSGSFMGSAFLHMAAEDWLRLGQLVLNRGMWGEGEDEQQIVPETWIDFMATPSPGSKKKGCSDSEPNFYGGQVWLYSCTYGDFPKDVVQFIGHNGQIIAVIPSEDLVYLKLGVDVGKSDVSSRSAIRKIIAALNEN